jgi:hypothetical protein
MQKSRNPSDSKQQPEADEVNSSPGDDSLTVTPKDVDPGFATARDQTVRRTTSPDPDEREEAMLDEAIEETFPASDPIAMPFYDATLEKRKQAREARDKAAQNKSS